MKGSDIHAVWHCLVEHDELRKQLITEGVVVRRSDTAGRPMNRRLEPSEEVDLDCYHECVLLVRVPCSVLKTIQEFFQASGPHSA